MVSRVLTSPLPPYAVAGCVEAGTDEAGRGCLAGPVYAAAVILPEDFSHPWLNDSKRLTERRREALRPLIMEAAIAWSIASVSAREIDDTNILKASMEAMHRALSALKVRPEHIAVDGNYFLPFEDIPHHTYIGGDGRFANIAAASILAKTERDMYMKQAAEEYPVYGWDVNKGYGTAAHRAAIAHYGPSPLHRLTFKLLPDNKN